VSVDATRKVVGDCDRQDVEPLLTGDPRVGEPGWNGLSLHRRVEVGTDHHTAALAVATIQRWWQAAGRLAHATSDRLLIASTHLWHNEIAALADETRLRITVCFLPPGTSRWSRIEQRLAAQLTIHERGHPLTSHEVVVETIAPAIHGAAADGNAARLANQGVPALPPDTAGRHAFHGEWNYTLYPSTSALRI
jgi:Rhodopirellula transposase DDE domain